MTAKYGLLRFGSLKEPVMVQLDESSTLITKVGKVSKIPLLSAMNCIL
jgi:hypothetical protein